MADRIFNDPEDLADILQSKIDSFGDEVTDVTQLPDSYALKDMDKAVQLFTETVSSGKKIKLISDSDCDGLGTYRLFWSFFSIFPYKNVEFVITQRSQGYGFLPIHVDDETELYITADNGITAIEATDAANCKGAKVIICDHHQVDPKGLPLAYAIIDPHQPGCSFEPKDISGTVVLYFFLQALVNKYEIDIDMFKECLPELCLTTISDVMPLDIPLNRFFIKKFLEEFNNSDSHRQYMNTFKSIVDGKITAENFSFGLIPSINASNRDDQAAKGGAFLVEDNPKNSNYWFEYIQDINNVRKKRQQELTDHVKRYFKDWMEAPFIVIPGHFKKEKAKGILGLISGNLARDHNKPCIAMNYSEATGNYTGSGRSIGDLNILGVLRDNPYIKMVGGHKAALGITIEASKLNDFWSRLQQDIIKVPDEILKPKKETMGIIPINKINWDFFEIIDHFEPFGQKFRKPIFRTTGIIKAASLMGKNRNHLRFTLTDTKGIVKFDGVKFFTTEVPEKGELYEVLFTLSRDDYKGGKNIKLMAEEFIKIIPNKNQEMNNDS